MGINMPGESGQKRWTENGWAAKLNEDPEIMFIQLKTLGHDEISS